ncbi:MAG: TonB family protein [Gemmatimonadetes bacterium]|nr:TonB family protein [Gemmatimonadota bacterium]
MFKKLIASEQRKRKPGWGMFTTTTSLLLHGLVLGGVMYASVVGPEEEVEEVEEEVTFVDVQEEPAPPPVAVMEQQPQSFQELVVPDVIPPSLPAIDLSAPPVMASDFSGLGVRRPEAVAAPTGPAPVDPGIAYPPTVLEVQPRLTNGDEIVRLLQRTYPRIFLEAGIAGVVLVQFVITAAGAVDTSTIQVIEASDEAFGRVATEVTSALMFTPGRYQGQNVQVLVQMPIRWEPVR